MAKVAKTEPNTTIVIGGQTFEFGDDGTRQVTEADIALLNDYQGSAKVEITESKPRKGDS